MSLRIRIRRELKSELNEQEEAALAKILADIHRGRYRPNYVSEHPIEVVVTDRIASRWPVSSTVNEPYSGQVVTVSLECLREVARGC